ncbi:MAG: type II toxin-antitoxin system VapC family toxin [Candidatus Binatia bacterium]
MVYLADTNVLLRFADRTHPVHPTVRAAVRKLRTSGQSVRATPQNFVEFWNVAARPIERNGFGLAPVTADRLLRLVERLFPLLPDSPAVYPEWRRLVVSFGVLGIQVHDARIVAAMIVHGVTHILTFNTTDFVRYGTRGIVAVDPTTV